MPNKWHVVPNKGQRDVSMMNECFGQERVVFMSGGFSWREAWTTVAGVDEMLQM